MQLATPDHRLCMVRRALQRPLVARNGLRMALGGLQNGAQRKVGVDVGGIGGDGRARMALGIRRQTQQLAGPGKVQVDRDAREAGGLRGAKARVGLAYAPPFEQDRGPGEQQFAIVRRPGQRARDERQRFAVAAVVMPAHEPREDQLLRST